MLETLLADLVALGDYDLITTRDARLPPLALPVDVRTVALGTDPWPLWQACIAEADACWPIAPESGGVLYNLSMAVGSKHLIGCRPDTLKICASKRATALHLAENGIPVVPTWLPDEVASEAPVPLVAKPDDGVGCEDTRIFASHSELVEWLKHGRSGSHVVQPWQDGTPASLSMLCAHGVAQLLSCNRQLITVEQGRPCYSGSMLNGMAGHWEQFAALAREIARCLPGLAGYVGVDVIVNDGVLVVLEINPRLTTSYAGLGWALGCNPAGLVLDLLYNARWMASDRLQRNMVEIRIDG